MLNLKRRDFVSLLAGAAISGPLTALAQTSPKTFHLGTLTPALPMDEKTPLGMILLKKLDRNGYALGKNLSFEARGARGEMSKLGEIVREMKANQIDVIVAAGYPPILACKVANVPTVVAFGGGDPVATHLIDTLKRPGGNITGISDNATTLSTKRLGLLKQAVPKLQKVAMLWNRGDPGMSMWYGASADAARSIGIKILELGVRKPDDFDGVFEAMDREPPEAIFGGHSQIEDQCPQSGVKRTSRGRTPMSAFDPKRTSAAQNCCCAT
jgi:putative ABC transport system substrate-binding protein